MMKLLFLFRNVFRTNINCFGIQGFSQTTFYYANKQKYAKNYAKQNSESKQIFFYKNNAKKTC